MAVSFDEFIQRIDEAGLITAADVRAFVDTLPEDRRPTDDEALAKALVAEKKLTPFQARQLWKGKGKSLVLGDYIVSDKIGAGGMGMVFKAYHRLMQRVVAIKVLPPAVTKDASTVQRFMREVQAAAKLTHPNIITAFDTRQSNGITYLVMEYAEGRDLSAIVKKQGPTTVAQAVDFTLQAARGLEYAHENGVIHRDIKPANLLFDKEGTVKILDMGLARIEAESVDAATQAGLTGTGMIMGTIDYMPPEQAVDTKSAGPQADIYSLGASLYYLLTAKPIVAGDTIGKKLQTLMTGRGLPDSISTERAEVPEALDAVFRKMTAFELSDRFQTMTEVISDLEAVQTGGVPGSKSSAGVERVAAGRSEESGVNSFVNGLEDGFSPIEATAVVKPKTGEFSDTLAGSVNEMTRPALSKTVAFSSLMKQPMRRNLIIGSSIAAVLLLGAIIWGFSGEGGNQPNISKNSTASKEKIPATKVGPLSRAPKYALEFDGVDDHVLLPISYDGSHPVTWEFWVKDIASAGTKAILATHSADNGRLSFTSDSRIHFWSFPNAATAAELYGGSQRADLMSEKLDLSGRFHVAAVFSGREIIIFLNGKEVSRTSALGRATGTPMESKLIRLGVEGLMGGEAHWLRGQIDEFRFSSIARYTSNFTPDESFQNDDRTIALYHFDAGQGDVLKDSSGNGHHGTIHGNPKWVPRATVASSNRKKAPPPAVAPFDEAKAKAHQKEWADYLGEPVETTNSIGMKFVVIPPGEFMMGEVENTASVTLSKSFRLGVHEVTQSQWKAVMATEPWKRRPNVREGEEVAATYVSWTDATEFCRNLTELERTAGRIHADEEYRLPTEAEWEYACRAGTTTRYSFGDDESQLGEYACYLRNAQNVGAAYAHTVGLKKPNAWGLYDILGNVWEWCGDWYGEKLSGGADLQGPSTGDSRVVRNGSWASGFQYLRSSRRSQYDPDHRTSSSGFRVVCELGTERAGGRD